MVRCILCIDCTENYGEMEAHMSNKLDGAAAKMIANLEEKYGKPLNEWIALGQPSGIVEMRNDFATLWRKPYLSRPPICHGRDKRYERFIISSFLSVYLAPTCCCFQSSTYLTKLGQTMERKKQ